MAKELPRSGDEQDWVSRRWRRMLCVFKNRSGLGKRVKRAMNKRQRRRWKAECVAPTPTERKEAT